MAKRASAGLSHEQRAFLWSRWKAGDSVSDIARALEVAGSRVHYVLERTGGILPLSLRRSAKALTLAEREEISRGVAAGYFGSANCHPFATSHLHGHARAGA